MSESQDDAPLFLERAADQSLIGRLGASGQVAGVLRARIVRGYFPTGARLSEEELRKELGVSRNTLREAFRLLAQERLLVHEFSRGVFLRTLSGADVLEIFRARRLVEGAVLRSSGPCGNNALEVAIRQGERSVACGSWRDCAAADIRFHQTLVDAAASQRLTDMVRSVLTELHLALNALDDLGDVFRRQLTYNKGIWRFLVGGDRRSALELLEVSLDEYASDLVELIG